MIETPPTIVVNRAIIEDHTRVLLLQRSNEDSHNPSKWEFPGGKVDPHERIFSSLIREVQEETGLQISSELRVVYQEDEIISEGKYKGHLYLALFHVAKLLAGDIALGPEHSAYSWARPDLALDRDLTDSSRRAMERYNELNGFRTNNLKF